MRAALLVLGVTLAVAAASGGCGSDGAASPSDFADAPAAVVTGDASALRIAIHSAPAAQPSRGVNALRLVVTRVADGAPAAGLDVSVTPWMPAMGHGASVSPTVRAAAEPGVYIAENVSLFMPGLWEIRTTIGGATSDHATAQFEIQ
ncbi:MAG: hypothetical protein JWP97_6574 [Labilithrix sp.]|nr:hypothetical protein [Labilithrix sp.]